MGKNELIGAAVILVLGILIGAGGMYQHYSKDQLRADAKVRKADNEEAKTVKKETKEQLQDKTLTRIVTKYKTEIVTHCPEMTDEKLDALCTNRYAPADIVQSLRQQISRARGRLD